MRKSTQAEKTNKNGYQSDDEKIRYKINKKYFQNTVKSPNKLKHTETQSFDDDDARYKFPSTLSKSKLEAKPKTKTKIKVNFWSNKDKHTGRRLHSTENKTTRRHTVAVTEVTPEVKLKPTVKVLKQVSFLPTPTFLDNHIPMVAVPDDLTIQLNEEDANYLYDDSNQAFVNSTNSDNNEKSSKTSMRKPSSLTQSSCSSSKRKWNNDGSDVRIDGNANELEFFSKYVVQKLRKMETNQRIYSENLINTVLMLGQLGKLNGKSKIGDV